MVTGYRSTAPPGRQRCSTVFFSTTSREAATQQPEEATDGTPANDNTARFVLRNWSLPRGTRRGRRRSAHPRQAQRVQRGSQYPVHTGLRQLPREDRPADEGDRVRALVRRD